MQTLGPLSPPPSLATRAQLESGRAREVSVAAATRAAPLCAGKRPCGWRRPRPSPPRACRGDNGTDQTVGTERKQKADQTLAREGAPSLPEPASRGRR